MEARTTTRVGAEVRGGAGSVVVVVSGWEVAGLRRRELDSELGRSNGGLVSDGRCGVETGRERTKA